VICNKMSGEEKNTASMSAEAQMEYILNFNTVPHTKSFSFLWPDFQYIIVSSFIKNVLYCSDHL